MRRISAVLLVAALPVAGCSLTSGDSADGSAPVVVITSPSTDTVADVVDFTATAVDDRGVQVVEFWVGNQMLTQDFTAPYTTRWNSVNNPDGLTILKVVARDFSGNQREVTKQVTVANGPN